MQLLDWRRWRIALCVLLICFDCFQSHMLHYMHLKKFLTAVAFARALGKKPSILPIPIPIPIPIAQNEVIKLPMGNNAKTTVVESKGANQIISHLLGGGGGSEYTGSSAYGYSVPGFSSSSNNINLSSLKGSDSNAIGLATALAGNGQGNGPTKIIILNAQPTQGSVFGARTPLMTSLRGPDIMKVAPSNNVYTFAGHGMNYGAIPGLGLHGMHLPGTGFGDLESAYSSSFPNFLSMPQNVYSRKPRRRYPPKDRGRYAGNGNDSREHSIQNEDSHRNRKKPIPVGEKYGYRPSNGA